MTTWADPERSLAYFPPQRLLRRGPDWVTVPEDVAATIEADAGLTKPAPPPSASASGFPAGNLAAVLAALAVVGLGVVVVSRRRTRSRGT